MFPARTRPVWMPMPCRMGALPARRRVAFHSSSRCRISSAARTASSACSAYATGAPKTAPIPPPMNWSTGPRGRRGGEDIGAKLGVHVFAERLLEDLALPQAPDHPVEALGHGAQLVVGDDG